MTIFLIITQSVNILFLGAKAATAFSAS